MKPQVKFTGDVFAYVIAQLQGNLGNIKTVLRVIACPPA